MATAATERAAPLPTTGGGGNRELKEKLLPVPKPNEKEYQERLEVENKAIEEIKGKINELQRRIVQLVGGRDEYNRKKQELRARLDEIQVQVDKCEAERKTLMETIELRQKEGREMKQSVQDMKKKLGFSTADQVDKRIAALEHSMMTNTLSLKEEKKLLDQIKQLKQSKPLIGKYTGLDKKLSSFEETSVFPLRTVLDEVRTRLLELRAARRDEQEKYSQLIQQRQQATAPQRELIEERERLTKEMVEHIEKRREIQDAYRKEMWKYNSYLAQQRHERNEKLREERMRRQAEQERASLERQLEMVDEDPVDAEIILLTHTIAYVKKIVETYNNTSSSAAEQQQQQQQQPQEKKIAGEKREANITVPEGEGLALLPKNQREEEYFFAPKGLKKRGEGKAKSQKPKCIKHDIGTLSYFEQCGVDAPVCEAELEPCMKVLTEKLEAAEQLRATKEARIAARREEIERELKAIDARMAAQMSPAEKSGKSPGGEKVDNSNNKVAGGGEGDSPKEDKAANGINTTED